MLEGRRIVLVEDDEIMGASLVQRLELEGAEVQWHRQILRALPAIRTPRKPVDAVICDIRLPDGTGEELYETLTRTGQWTRASREIAARCRGRSWRSCSYVGPVSGARQRCRTAVTCRGTRCG